MMSMHTAIEGLWMIEAIVLSLSMGYPDGPQMNMVMQKIPAMKERWVNEDQVELMCILDIHVCEGNSWSVGQISDSQPKVPGSILNRTEA